MEPLVTCSRILCPPVGKPTYAESVTNGTGVRLHCTEGIIAAPVNPTSVVCGMTNSRLNSDHPGTDFVPNASNANSPAGHEVMLGPEKGNNTELTGVKVSAGRPDTAGTATS